MNRKDFIRKSGSSFLCVAAAPVFLGNESGKLSCEESQSNGGSSIMHGCKITVLKREFYQDFADKYLANPNVGKCNRFKDGQEFILQPSDYFNMMNGDFCSEAWAAISHYVYAALQGGSIMRGWTKDERVMIACCNDGVRPVVFKIERIDQRIDKSGSGG